jgi:hypothetical protein
MVLIALHFKSSTTVNRVAVHVAGRKPAQQEERCLSYG